MRPNILQRPSYYVGLCQYFLLLVFRLAHYDKTFPYNATNWPQGFEKMNRHVTLTYIKTLFSKTVIKPRQKHQIRTDSINMIKLLSTCKIAIHIAYKENVDGLFFLTQTVTRIVSSFSLFAKTLHEQQEKIRNIVTKQFKTLVKTKPSKTFDNNYLHLSKIQSQGSRRSVVDVIADEIHESYFWSHNHSFRTMNRSLWNLFLTEHIVGPIEMVCVSYENRDYILFGEMHQTSYQSDFEPLKDRFSSLPRFLLDIATLHSENVFDIYYERASNLEEITKESDLMLYPTLHFDAVVDDALRFDPDPLSNVRAHVLDIRCTTDENEQIDDNELITSFRCIPSGYNVFPFTTVTIDTFCNKPFFRKALQLLPLSLQKQIILFAKTFGQPLEKTIQNVARQTNEKDIHERFVIYQSFLNDLYVITRILYKHDGNKDGTVVVNYGAHHVRTFISFFHFLQNTELVTVAFFKNHTATTTKNQPNMIPAKENDSCTFDNILSCFHVTQKTFMSIQSVFNQFQLEDIEAIHLLFLPILSMNPKHKTFISTYLTKRNIVPQWNRLLQKAANDEETTCTFLTRMVFVTIILFYPTFSVLEEIFSEYMYLLNRKMHPSFDATWKDTVSFHCQQ